MELAPFADAELFEAMADHGFTTASMMPEQTNRCCLRAWLRASTQASVELASAAHRLRNTRLTRRF